MKRYEQIPHTADIAARIYSKNIPELFENAAYAMFDMMCSLKEVNKSEIVNIEVEAPDTESLLVAWLNELLYTSYTKQVHFSEFNVVSLKKNKLTAEAKGQKLEKNVLRNFSEIKAATYHDIEITRTESGYETTIVFDV